MTEAEAQVSEGQGSWGGHTEASEATQSGGLRGHTGRMYREAVEGQGAAREAIR